jgi:hypothetical protein
VSSVTWNCWWEEDDIIGEEVIGGGAGTIFISCFSYSVFLPLSFLLFFFFYSRRACHAAALLLDRPTRLSHGGPRQIFNKKAQNINNAIISCWLFCSRNT